MSDPTLFRCRPCQAGLYKDWVGQEICRPCPPFSSSLPGAARLVDCTCIPGYVGRNGSECSACAPGTFKNLSGPQECAMCSQGKFSGELAGVAACISCSPGSYKNATGSALCTLCEAGMYSDTFAAESPDTCRPCPENTLSLRGSRDKMQCLCSPGFTGPIGGPCHACAAGG